MNHNTLWFTNKTIIVFKPLKFIPSRTIFNIVFKFHLSGKITKSAGNRITFITIINKMKLFYGSYIFFRCKVNFAIDINRFSTYSSTVIKSSLFTSIKFFLLLIDHIIVNLIPTISLVRQRIVLVRIPRKFCFFIIIYYIFI